MAQAMIARRRGGRPAAARRHGRRIHRRQHRRVAGAGLRRQGLSAAASSPPTPSAQRSSTTWRRLGAELHAGPQRRRPHHREAHPRHDRGGAAAQPRSPAPAGPTSSTTPTASPATTRWARRSGRRPAARSTPSCSASAPRRRCAASPTVLKRHKPDDPRSSPSSRPNPPCCPAAQPGAHKIEGIGIGFVPPLWEPTLVDEIDRGRRPTTPRRWRGAWRARKGCSPAPPPAPMSSRRCGWPSGWVRGNRRHGDVRFRDEIPEELQRFERLRIRA